MMAGSRGLPSGTEIFRFDRAIKVDGKILSEGYIGLQSESHLVEFRNVRLMELKGCMDPKAANHKPYYVARDDSRCVKH